MGEVRDHWDLFQKGSATVVAITFSPYQDGVAIRKELRLPFPVVSDPGREIYRMAQAATMRWRDFFSWKLAVVGWKALRNGSWPSFRYDKSDVKQLGGDLVANAQGEVTFRYLSKSPEDRPPLDQILKELNLAKG